jgi:hypothetical protein
MRASPAGSVGGTGKSTGNAAHSAVRRNGQGHGHKAANTAGSATTYHQAGGAARHAASSRSAHQTSPGHNAS